MIDLNSDSINLNNEVHLAGRVSGELNYSHEVYGERFLSFVLKVERLSDSSDYINVTVSERLIKDLVLKDDTPVEIEGQFRSYNNYTLTGSKLILTVFARDISVLDDENFVPANNIFLNGFVCKEPVYRITPFGREITDLLIAANRAYNKSDYMPCIAWGRNARYSGKLKVGENVKIWGRIQSREYQKRISDDEVVTRTAFEISISKMELVAKEEDNSENTIINL